MKPSKAANDRVVVGIATVTVHLNEVVKQSFEEVQCIRPLGVTGEAHTIEGRGRILSAGGFFFGHLQFRLPQLRWPRELRRHDLVLELGDESFRLKKTLETASKIGARFALIVGENEAKSGQFALKNLASGEQVSVARAELPRTIQSL